MGQMVGGEWLKTIKNIAEVIHSLSKLGFWDRVISLEGLTGVLGK